MANQQSKSRDQKRKAKLKARAVRCGCDEVVRSRRDLSQAATLEASSKLERRTRQQAQREFAFMNEQDNRLILLTLATLSGSVQAQEQFHSLAAEMIADGRGDDVDAICRRLVDAHDQFWRHAEAAMIKANSFAQNRLQEAA